MPDTIRHCRSCLEQTRHRHLHDCTEGPTEKHVHGTERFECVRCGLPTFATSEHAHRFPFAVDVPERVQALADVGARR